MYCLETNTACDEEAARIEGLFFRFLEERVSRDDEDASFCTHALGEGRVLKFRFSHAEAGRAFQRLLDGASVSQA